jgi:hypothetical protein
MNEQQALAEIVQTLTVDHGCHAGCYRCPQGSDRRGGHLPPRPCEGADRRRVPGAAWYRVSSTQDIFRHGRFQRKLPPPWNARPTRSGAVAPVSRMPATSQSLVGWKSPRAREP